MEEVTCKGETKSGNACKNKANENGYCSLHSPSSLQKKQDAAKREKRQNEVLNAIYAVCKNTGWNCRLISRDEETLKYATLALSKSFPNGGYSDEKVTAVIELAVDNGIKFQIQETSFHRYGLKSLTSSIEAALGELGWVKENKLKTQPPEIPSSMALVENLLNRFDRTARQLKRRYDNRPTIEIKDEYDVQDLLHGMLKCYFDDVRPEDYTPSYAGSCSRMDFLLKKEKIVIEVKYATSKLKDKKIGEQLIVDIKRYESHPDCCTLFCFIYDPDGNIHNPIALENDLTGIHGKNNLKVKIIISPK